MFDSNLCAVCDDSISDPVCKSCYTRQIKILLADLAINSLTKKIILDKIKKGFPPEVLNDIDCILCRQGNVGMCRYCFSETFVGVLRDAGFTEEMIDYFGYSTMYNEGSFGDEV